MGVHLDQYGISYFSVPKCACTSIKHFFFEIENGFEFKRFRVNGEMRHIHNAVYGSLPFKEEVEKAGAQNWKIAVVRDPISRFLSCYSNKVLKKAVLEKVTLSDADRKAGLSNAPDLSSYVRDFEGYSRVSKVIYRHTRPMTDYLGSDPSYFDKVYPIGRLDQLVEDVKKRVGDVPALRRRQGNSPKISADALSADETQKIRAIYARDYEVFGALF